MAYLINGVVKGVADITSTNGDLNESPLNYQGETFLTGGVDTTPHAYVFALRDTGELCFDVKDANVGLYGSFPYPVAED